LQYVLYHLTASSLHESLSEDERLDTLLRTVVLEKEETFQERDSYRKEVLKDAEKEEKAKKKREAAAMSGGQDDVHVRNVVRAPAKGSGKKLPIGAPAPPRPPARPPALRRHVGRRSVRGARKGRRRGQQLGCSDGGYGDGVAPPPGDEGDAHARLAPQYRGLGGRQQQRHQHRAVVVEHRRDDPGAEQLLEDHW